MDILLYCIRLHFIVWLGQKWSWFGRLHWKISLEQDGNVNENLPIFAVFYQNFIIFIKKPLKFKLKIHSWKSY